MSKSPPARAWHWRAGKDQIKLKAQNMKYFIKTFGCQQNVADSEAIEANLVDKDMTKSNSYSEADYIVINTCMVRQTAENRVYGLVRNLAKIKKEKKAKKQPFKIIVTGCMVGLAKNDKSGKFLHKIKKAMPEVDKFLPIEKLRSKNQIRQDKKHAYIPISYGCNNFCSYCVVPFARGKEISRPFNDIIKDALCLKKQGYKKITLLGQNVNSYSNTPTLFPNLLEKIAKMGFEEVSFMSSNPWDFSDELIDVIAKNKNISRIIHLPVQSGDDNVLKRMNRWYTHNDYLKLVANLKLKIKNLKLTTDIIVGFCGETNKEFQNTVKLAKKVRFEKAYISMYSPRYNTSAMKNMKDDIPHKVKKQRWQVLENLINKPHLKKRVKML